MLFQALRKPSENNLLKSAKSFQYFEYAMFWMGWSTPKSYKIVYKAMGFFIAAWCVVYLPIGIIINLAKDYDTITPRELLNTLQLFFNGIGTPIKVLYFRLNMWRFHGAKGILGQMDKRCGRLEERVEVHRWVVHCNSAYLLFLTMYTGFAITSFLSSAVSGVPIGIYNPFIDWQKNRKSFWIFTIHEGTLILFSSMHTMMSDIYPLLYGMILRGHIKIVRLRIENLCRDPHRSDEDNQVELVNCIKDHKLLQEYAAMVRPVIASTIFVQFLLIGILLGLSMINLYLFADIWSGLSTLVYIVGLMFQTSPFCYVCDQIRSDCEQLSMAIFHSDWLRSSRKYKMYLIFFLQNSQKSIAFIAGSIFPISTSTNISVAKLAFTVATFVNQMNIADKLNKDK